MQKIMQMQTFLVPHSDVGLLFPDGQTNKRNQDTKKYLIDSVIQSRKGSDNLNHSYFMIPQE